MAKTAEQIKDLVRKLLAKADNTACSVEEAKAFNDKAHALMAEWNLDRAMLGTGEKDARRTHRELQVLKRPWSSQILHAICNMYYCKWYFTRISDRMDKITIVGEESNVAVCHAICVMVLRAVQTEARKTGGGRSFMTGAASSIYERCALTTKNSAVTYNTGQSTALVVLSTNEQAANIRYIEEVIGLKLGHAKKSRPQIKSSGAFEAGRSYGQSVNLNSNLLR